MSIYHELYDDVFKILRTQLPSYLTYHTPEHTLYVLEKAEFISGKENVAGHELLLIRIACLFHDIGFIVQNHHHEEKGCEICTEKLRQYDFSQEDIRKICGMIMATKIPQMPQTLSERIVADADLEYLGTDLFYPVSQNLYREFLHYDPQLDLQRFNEIQINFIRKHKYHTEYCRTHREEKKQQHLQELLGAKV
jgi:uncharacterized protein